MNCAVLKFESHWVLPNGTSRGKEISKKKYCAETLDNVVELIIHCTIWVNLFTSMCQQQERILSFNNVRTFHRSISSKCNADDRALQTLAPMQK